MKRIAFYSREFRLCEWPEEPVAWSMEPVEIYEEAITSAMKNGVAFADQERIKSWLLNTKGSWQPKEGDNWPAPEGAEIKEKCYGCRLDPYAPRPIVSALEVKDACLNGDKLTCCFYSKVAVLRSESVEKKESRCTLSDKELVEAIHKLVTKQCKTGQGWLMTVPVDFNRDSDMLISELIKRFEVLNQSTPKE